MFSLNCGEADLLFNGVHAHPKQEAGFSMEERRWVAAPARRNTFNSIVAGNDDLGCKHQTRVLWESTAESYSALCFSESEVGDRGSEWDAGVERANTKTAIEQPTRITLFVCAFGSGA